MGQPCSSAKHTDEMDIVERAKIERMRSSLRRPGFTAEKVTDEKLSSWKPPVTPKSEEVILRIRNIIVNNEKLALKSEFSRFPYLLTLVKKQRATCGLMVALMIHF